MKANAVIEDYHVHSAYSDDSTYPLRQVVMTGQEPPGRSPLRMWIIRSMQMKYPAYRKNTEN